SAVDAYIEKNSGRFVDELKELCSFPSICNHGREAIQPARDWLAERLAKLTDRVETLEAGGMPPLCAEVPGAGRRELLLYAHDDGRPTLQFGCRGLVYVTLRVQLLDYDQHSGFASIYPSAAHYLLGALASLGDREMNVKIEGFYDKVVQPTEADRRMMAGIDPEIEKRRKLVGFDKRVRDPKPDQVIEQMLFLPTCNIAGLTTGYQGPGAQTVLPAGPTAT